jgi:hypothetical protein
MARVGGARRQAHHLLRLRHRQRAGDVCPAERWRIWSRAWTCCSGYCASRRGSRFKIIGSPRPLLWAVQPMQAKRRCTELDKIGTSSTDSESKMDSSWKPEIKRRRRVGLASTAASTWELEFRVRTAIVWQTSHAFCAAAASPNLSRVVRIPWPALAATKGCTWYMIYSDKDSSGGKWM